MARGRHGVVEQQVTALVARALAESSRRAEPHPVPGAPAMPSAGVTPGPSPAPAALRCAAQVAPEPGSWGTATAGAVRCWCDEGTRRQENTSVLD